MLLRSFKFFTLFALMVTHVHAECRKGFEFVENKCLSIETKSMVNWHEAARQCKQLQAQLLAINSQLEMKALEEFLHTKSLRQNFWTSGTDLGSLGLFYWDANGKWLSYNKWQTKEPFNVLTKMQNCLRLDWISKENSYYMRDDDCSSTAGYICEVNAIYEEQSY